MGLYIVADSQEPYCWILRLRVFVHTQRYANACARSLCSLLRNRPNPCKLAVDEGSHGFDQRGCTAPFPIVHFAPVLLH